MPNALMYCPFLDKILSDKNSLTSIQKLVGNDENTYDNFINMMYNESDKTIIDYDLFPEYNIEKEHDYIYNQYIITDN